MWIDLEGFECKALLGAKKIIHNGVIPVLMELNPYKYENQGIWKEFIENVSDIYDSFIDLRETRRVIAVSDLESYSRDLKDGVTDIFLIHKEANSYCNRK